MELSSSTTSTTGTLDTQTPPPPPNGFLNRRNRNTAPSSHPPTTVVVSYKECLRNHAASIGGHALDGCGEFLPSPEPNSLSCAACECHRNFHRRHTQQFPNPTFISFYSNPSRNGDFKRENPKGKKRQRTKFNEEQKEKMFEFCEKLGWRMPNTEEHEGMVQEFCNSIGVSKGIFKVWMHNNKNRKRLLQIQNNNASPLDEEKINGHCN